MRSISNRILISWPSFLRVLVAAVAVTVVLVVPAGVPAASLSGAPPGGLSAFAADASVGLAWQPVAGASGYTVYRGASASTVVMPLGSVSGTNFTDSGLVDGSTYYYGVRAVVSGVESGSSPVAQATPLQRGCSSGNAVVLENCYPGTAGWKTQAATDAAHGGIEGFATATSINAGESVDLKVSTAAGAPYRVEIYRTGYYGGLEGRLVSVLPGLVGVAQPGCLTNGSTGLVDCSNWSVTSTLTTTAAWPSGVYVLRLVRQDNGTDNHVLLVVRHDGDAAVHVCEHRVEDEIALGLGEPGDLAGDAERREPVHAVSEKQPGTAAKPWP